MSRIICHFRVSRDTWSLWKGIQTIMDYKPSPQTCDSYTTLLSYLNNFSTRFDAQNNIWTCEEEPTTHWWPDYVLVPSQYEDTLSKINVCKPDGSDNIPGCVLKDSVEEMSSRTSLTHLWPRLLFPHASKPQYLPLCQKSNPHHASMTTFLPH